MDIVPSYTSCHQYGLPQSRRRNLVAHRSFYGDGHSATSLPRRCTRKIRGQDAHVTYFLSYGAEPLSSPDNSIACMNGDLFVHRWSVGQTPQIWMKDARGTWDRIYPCSARHPFLPDHRLHLTKSGEPSWITKKSVVTYRGRERQRMRGAHVSRHVF